MTDQTTPGSDKDLAYWLSICPFELSEKDRKSLLTKTDAEWEPHTWNELKDAIDQRDFGNITRWPTQLRKYIFWRREMEETYPEISQFIITQRLNWPLPTSTGFTVHDPNPLAHPSDYTILRNDWPYAVTPDICAIVIWLKHHIPVDNDPGEPTPDSTARIEEFVDHTFRRRINESNSSPDAEVLWFKNPTKWQSVRTLEHFHVLTRGVGDGLIEELTGQRREDVIAYSWKGQGVGELV